MFKMQTRVGHYIINWLFIFVTYKVLGFELAVISGIGIILGEISFREQKQKEK